MKYFKISCSLYFIFLILMLFELDAFAANMKSPYIIYIAVDSPEPFMQITIDHEVSELKKLCLRNKKVKAAILISSQFTDSLKKDEFPKVTFCSDGIIKEQFIKLIQFNELQQTSINSPFADYKLLNELYSYLISNNLPFSDQVPFIQIKSHGDKDNVIIYLSNEMMSNRIESQHKVLDKFNIPWPTSSNIKFGDGKYETAFKILEKDFLSTISSDSNSMLSERSGLNANISEDKFSTPKLSLKELELIVKSNSKDGRIGYIFNESCKNSSRQFNSTLINEMLNKEDYYIGSFTAEGSLNYHNLDWSEFENMMDNADLLSDALSLKISKLPEKYPDDENFIDELRMKINKVENKQEFEQILIHTLITDQNPNHRKAAAWQLGNFKSADNLIQLNLANAIEDENIDVVISAISSLYKLKINNLAVYHKLINVGIKHQNNIVRYFSIMTLSKSRGVIKSDLIKSELIKLFSIESDFNTRSAIIHTLSVLYPNDSEVQFEFINNLFREKGFSRIAKALQNSLIFMKIKDLRIQLFLSKNMINKAIFRNIKMYETSQSSHLPASLGLGIFETIQPNDPLVLNNLINYMIIEQDHSIQERVLLILNMNNPLQKSTLDYLKKQATKAVDVEQLKIFINYFENNKKNSIYQNEFEKIKTIHSWRQYCTNFCD